MKTPFFTIICPIYNKANCIEQTVNSIINQTFSNIEIIFVDDKSTDNTVLKIKKLIKEKSNIKIIQHKKNMGVHQARTTGVNEATGKYILFLDGDDVLEFDACQIIFETIKNYTADVYEFGYYKNPEHRICLPPAENRNRVESLLSSKNSYPATIWNKAYKTVIVKTSFYNSPFIPQNGPEDLYEAIIMAYHTKTYFTINKPLYNYNMGLGISTRKRNFEDNTVYFKNMNLIIKLTKTFFMQTKSEYVKMIPELEKRLIRDAVGWFISNLTIKDDINKSYLLLPKYFSIEAILPFFEKLMEKAENYNNGKWNIKNFIKQKISTLHHQY